MKKVMEKVMKKVPDYVERMIEEINNLTGKIDKLSDFIDKDNFDDLPVVKKALLYTQLDIMKSYANVLRLRIQIECKEITSLEDKGDFS